MKERTVMENQESVEIQGEDWVVEARKQIDNIKRDANREADLNQKVQAHQDVQAYQDYGRPWQEVRQEVYGKHYDLYLKNFAKGNLTETKRYAQDWDQFIQAHPEVINLARSELTTWFLENKTPFDQADNLLISREMARGVQMAEATPSPAAGGGDGQPPEPPAPPAPPGGETPDEPEDRSEESAGPDNLVFEEVLIAIGLPNLMDSVRNELLRDPVEQQRRSQDAFGFEERVRAEASRRAIQQAREISRSRRPETRRPETRRIKKRGSEAVQVSTQQGIEVTYFWPDTPEGKMQELRKIMVSIESTLEAEGGDVNRADLTELSLVINALRTSDIEDKRKEGEDMYKELIARFYLHGAFLQFNKAPEVENVTGIVSILTKDHMNYLFREMPEVWQAFVYYENKASDYLSAKGEELERFRNDVRESLGSSVSEYDKKSAQVIAERLWQLTGRRVIRDELVNKDFKDQSATTEDKKTGKAAFRGEANFGNFALRRVLKFNDWLYTRVESDRPFLQLIDGVDIKSGDFLSGLPDEIAGFYGVLLYKRYQNEDKEVGVIDVSGQKVTRRTNEKDKDGNYAYAKSKAEEDAHEIARILTGAKDKNKTIKENGKERVDIDKLTERPKKEWLEEKGGYIDITGIKWRPADVTDEAKRTRLQEILGEVPQIDFAIFSDNPMSFWAYIKASQPEKARDALAGKTESFLRTPSSKSLLALIDIFAYQRDDQFKVKAQLAANFVKFLRSNESRRAGYIRPDNAMVDTIISNMVQSLGLRPKEAQEMSRKILGDTIFDELVLGLSYYRADRFLLGFILELLKGILQQGLSLK